MTKSEFTEKMVSKCTDLTAEDVQVAVNTLFEYISSVLEKGGRIEIRGFGCFSLRHMSAHQGRNPRTGETIQVLQRSVVHFKPGLELRERVNTNLRIIEV